MYPKNEQKERERERKRERLNLKKNPLVEAVHFFSVVIQKKHGLKT